MIVNHIAYNEKLKEVTNQLTKGAFLTVKAGDVTNIMTIGWSMLGHMWNRPIFQILVRTSRYTYDLIQQCEDFTVSVPLNKDMKDELLLCGTKSGRSVDKVAACGFTLAPGMMVTAPIIADCSLHYECKIVAQQKFPIEQLNGEEGEADEGKVHHYHIMYYGEIVACYLTSGK